jgi:6-pyruvoyltetrahydropterin/6-carboxytetrahydropterin synthase
MEHYHILVSGDDLVFSAAHFITLTPDQCEPLHGHNYRVAAELHGPLDENRYVADFVAVREALRRMLSELDHHVLLPTAHPAIQATVGDQEVEVRFAERRWVFPRADCALLPMANTTAELLARHVGRKLLEEMDRRNIPRPSRLGIEVEECCGSLAAWQWRPG